MAKILLIETSTEVCSAAISVDGNIVALAENPEAPSHAALLTLQIETCSQKAGIPLAQLDAVALSGGPGAYTSLRVGAAVAKGICYALGKPLIAVDTLLALAHATREKGARAYTGADKTSFLFVPLLDARRQEVWLAIYDSDLLEIAPAQPLILENNSFEMFILEKAGNLAGSGVILAGNGMEKLRNGRFSGNTLFSELTKCSAGYLASLAEQNFQNNDFKDIAYYEPFYMKPPNITTPASLPF